MGRDTTFWPPAPDLQRARLDLEFQGINFQSHLVAPTAGSSPRPLVMVVHNYQGLKQFDLDVAEYLARLGYVGLAVDLYGDRVPADQREFPQDATAIPAFQQRCFAAMVALDHDPASFRSLMAAWLDLTAQQAWVDASQQPTVMGYCFGGMAAIECIRGGLKVAGALSLHGLLQTGEDPNPAHFGAIRPALKPAPNHYNTSAVLVIENGADDHLVPEDSQRRFFAEMDAAGVDWNFHHRAQTPHGFALPTRIGPPGHLHEKSDRRSTQSLLALLRELYPQVAQQQVAHNAAGTRIP